MCLLCDIFTACSDGIDEEYIRTLFVSTGGTVQNFRFFQ